MKTPFSDIDAMRDAAGAMSQPVTMSGDLSKNFSEELVGKEGEKRGVVPAKDEGIAKEFVKGVDRGIVQLQSSVGKTLGMKGVTAAKDYFLRTNQQLFDSERKGALSYIANTGGAAIGQNLPNFAAMLALGGAGAPAWAIRGTMMGGTYLQSYGDNKEELDRHVGDGMSPVAKTGTAVAQSIVDSILEIGLGAEARAVKSVSKLAMAKKLAQAGGITEMEKLGTRTMGVLGKAARSEVMKSGLGEVSDQFLQNIHKDIVNLSLDDKATGQDVLKRLAEYPRELQEAFIGGAFMDIVPSTINAIANARTTAEINRLTEDNKKKQELIDTATVEQDGVTRTFVDEEAKARTAQAFADFSEVVKNKNVGSLMYKMAYNMAYAEKQADPKSTVRPESYIGELKVLFADKGVDMKRVEELSGNTGELLKYLASKDAKFSERLSNMADSLESFDLNRQLDPVRRDVATKAPSITEVEKDSIGQSIDKMMGGVRTDIIPAGDIKKLVPKEVLRRMYAGRVLQGVQIGKAKFDLLVQDGLSVRVFDEGALAIKQVGGDKLSQKLAGLRKESVDIAQSLQRLQNFDGVYAGKAPVALLTPGVRFVAGERGVEDVRSQLNPYFSANAKLENIWNDAQKGNAQAVDALKYLNIKAKADITAIEEDRAKRAKVPTLREIAEERWAQEAEADRVKVWGEESPHDALMRLAGEATRYQPPEEGATSRLLRLGQESQTKGGPLFSKTGKGQIVGQYQRDQKLAIFYADHDASTIVHEWFHHLTENRLMPSKFQQALTDSFAVQTGDERRWNAASAENAASAFLQYVRDGQLPESAAVTDAFQYIKGILKSHWQELNQVVTVDGDLADTGAELDFSKYENLKKEFDGLFADTAADQEQAVYGGALTASMLAGDVSDPVYVSDGSLRAAAARATAKQGAGLDADTFVKQQLVARPDLFGGRDRLENLSPEERAVAQLFFEQMASSEETGPVVDEKPQVLFARKPAEERRKTLWRMAHRGFADHDAASEYARAKFKVRSMADLTDEQLQQMVGRDGAATVDPDIDDGASALSEAINQTTGGLRVGPEVWGNPLQRFVNNVLIRGAKSIGEGLIGNYLMDWDGMWKYVAENVANPVIDDFRHKFTAMRNAVSRTRSSFITDFLKDADAQGLDQSFRMSLNGHKVNIGGLALTPSQALDIWLKADFGKNLQRSDIVRMREASPEYTESVVKAAVKYVEKTDPRLAKLGVLMQKYNTRVFTPAADVYKRVTGKELPPITGAYTPLLYANGNPHEFGDDYLKFLESLDQRQPPSQPGAPSGLHSRSGTSGSGILLDAWGNFARHADTLMNYAEKAEGVKETVQLLNDKRVIDAFSNKYGTIKYRDALLRMARRELTPGAMLKNANNEYLGAAARKLMTNAYHAFLPYNPFTVMTQTISVANGMATIPAAESVEMTKNFLALSAKLRLGMINGEKVENSEEFKFVRKHSPYITEAFKVPSQEQYIESINNKGIDALRIGSWTFGQFKDKGLHFMYNMDVIVRLSVYRTAFEFKARELRMKGVAEPVVETRAAQYAEDCIRLSQNPSSSHERSLLQSEAPEMAKLFIPFTSQPFSNLRYQVLNMLLPTVRAWDKAGVKGVLSQVVANPSIYYKMAMSTVVPALMLGMIARRRPQKDLEELLNDLKFSLIINIPIIGHAAWASAALGWDSAGGGGLMGDLLGGLTDVVSDVIGGDFDFKTAANARRSLELLTGVPDWPIKVATRLYDKVAVVGGKWDGQSVLKITGLEAR